MFVQHKLGHEHPRLACNSIAEPGGGVLGALPALLV